MAGYRLALALALALTSLHHSRQRPIPPVVRCPGSGASMTVGRAGIFGGPPPRRVGAAAAAARGGGMIGGSDSRRKIEHPSVPGSRSTVKVDDSVAACCERSAGLQRPRIGGNSGVRNSSWSPVPALEEQPRDRSGPTDYEHCTVAVMCTGYVEVRLVRSLCCRRRRGRSGRRKLVWQLSG